jgi:hypothetical protein
VSRWTRSMRKRKLSLRNRLSLQPARCQTSRSTPALPCQVTHSPNSCRTSTTTLSQELAVSCGKILTISSKVQRRPITVSPTAVDCTSPDSNSSDRQRIIQKFYTRFLHDFDYKDELSRPKGRCLTSAHCWAFLQVADMTVMRQIETSIGTSALPKVFEEIENIYTS